MFLNSIINGLSLLGDWQICVSLLLITAIIVGFKIICDQRINVMVREGNARLHVMVKFYKFGLYILSPFLLSIFVGIFSNAILFGERIEADIPVSALIWPILYVGTITSVVSALILWLPGLGNLYGFWSIRLFAEGTIILRIYFQDTLTYPTILAYCGYLAIAFMSVVIVNAISAIVTVLIKRTSPLDTYMEGANARTAVDAIMDDYIGPTLWTLTGFLVFLMYSQYIYLTMSG